MSINYNYFKFDSNFAWPNYPTSNESSSIKRKRVDGPEEITLPEFDTEIHESKRIKTENFLMQPRYEESQLKPEPKFRIGVVLKEIALTQKTASIIQDIASVLYNASINPRKETILFLPGKSKEKLIAKKVIIDNVANDPDLTKPLQMSLKQIQSIFDDLELRKFYFQGLKDFKILSSPEHTALRGALFSINIATVGINFARSKSLPKFESITIKELQQEKPTVSTIALLTLGKHWNQ